jgi:uncharacterized repeat protein (TIGR01451 family)
LPDNSGWNPVVINVYTFGPRPGAAPPVFTKAFGALFIPINGTTTLTFTITNPNSVALLDVQFTDNLPSGMLRTNDAFGSSTCGTVDISNVVQEQPFTLAANSSCQIQFDVTDSVAGNAVNIPSPVTSDNAPNSNQPLAVLIVIVPPTFTKSFNPSSIAPGGVSALTFAITNPNGAEPLTFVKFTDTFPSGVTLVNTVSDSCLGTLTTTTGSVQLSFGNVSNSCSITVNVTAANAGKYVNTSGAVISAEAPPSQQPSATLFVGTPLAISKVFGAGTIPMGGSTSLTFTITNPDPIAQTGVGFTDTLPSGLSAGPILTNTCGGTAQSTTGSVSLSGGGVAASGSCTITVNVTGTTAGVKNNTTSTVSSNEFGAGNTASASITVLAPPGFSKSFVPSMIPPGGTSELIFTISNTNSSTISGLAFTDTLPAGLQVAHPSALASNCDGIVELIVPSGRVSLSGASLAANSSCTITLNVTAAGSGVFNNVTSQISSSNAGNGPPAMATLTVAAPPTIAKAFSRPDISNGGTVVLTFTITNPNQNVPLTGIQFTDTLPAGLVIASPNGPSSGCGGTISPPPGGSTITFSGGTLAAGASCSFTVGVTATKDGTFTNVTGTITSDQTGPGGTATASIVVGIVFQVSYAANLNTGDGTVRITNDGDVSGQDPAGNLCADVYVFAPDQQLLSCCSCPATPNGLLTLSINNALLSNTLTGVKPPSVVLELLYSLPDVNGSCANRAASPTPLAAGLTAWRTSITSGPINKTSPDVETRFASPTLSAAELSALGNDCALVVHLGSGAGVCSCGAGEQ